MKPGLEKRRICDSIIIWFLFMGILLGGLGLLGVGIWGIVLHVAHSSQSNLGFLFYQIVLIAFGCGLLGIIIVGLMPERDEGAEQTGRKG
jgi:hypothetical protein